MIYVTLGTMFLDFPRLTHAMDTIAAKTGERVVMQLGMSKTIPQHCECFDFKPHQETLDIQRQARLVVCHAGIGAVTDALHVRRPFIVTPRLKRFREHMNDHQMELAQAVARRGWGRVVLDMADLESACADPLPFPEGYTPDKERLLNAVQAFVSMVALERG